MDIFLFIVLIFAVISLKVIPQFLSDEGKKDNNVNLIAFALLIAIGSLFVQPLILNWFTNYLFGITFDYWVAFMVLLVLSVFTYRVEEKNRNRGE